MSRRERQQREDERTKLARLQADEDLKAVMGSPAGRRFVYRVCFDTCAILGGTFTGNSETFYREGRRSIGVHLWAEAQRVAPADVVRAHEDAVQAQREAHLRQLTEALEKPEEPDE